MRYESEFAGRVAVAAREGLRRSRRGRELRRPSRRWLWVRCLA
jgi:hypothetical protein